MSNSSFTVLTFVLPVFELPGEFANFTDPSLDFPFNTDSRRRRSLTGMEQHHTVSVATLTFAIVCSIFIANARPLYILNNSDKSLPISVKF